MNRILLTGATGFVGLPVAQKLAAAGHDLTCVIRTGTEERLEGLNTRTMTCDDIFSQPSDWWTKILTDQDICIHLAWYAEPGKYLNSAQNLDCLAGTLSMARGAVDAKLPRFVGIGTCFEYDLAEGELSIETPLAPDTPYAAAKTAAFTMLKAWFATTDVEFLWARLFYLHGHREDRRRLVPYLHQQLSNGQMAELTSGTAVRDYLNVDKAAEMLVSDVLSRRVGPVNICSGMAVTIRELAEEIAKQYGRQDLLKFGARPDNLTDPPIVIGKRAEHTI